MSIVVVGDATLDISVFPSQPMRLAADVPASIRLAPGGQGANVAVRLARRGASVELVTGLADDAAAALLRAALAADGVRVAPVPVDATATVVIVLDRRGERSMLSHRSPFAARAAGVVDPAAEWLVVSGYLLLEPDAPVLATALAGHGARRVLLGCSVPAPERDAWRAAAEALRPDLVVLNRDEAATLGVPAGAGRVVTDADRATAAIGPLRAEVRREPGDHPSDTTGAGDAFAATLVADLAAASWPPAESVLTAALTDAVAVATAVSRTPGAQARVTGEREPVAGP